jgi:hypothetical protein
MCRCDRYWYGAGRVPNENRLICATSDCVSDPVGVVPPGRADLVYRQLGCHNLVAPTSKFCRYGLPNPWTMPGSVDQDEERDPAILTRPGLQS